jgi:hypothetical protein
MDVNSASPLKQQSTNRHEVPLRHMLNTSPLVFELIPELCVIIEEATNTNVIVSGWTRPGVQPTTYRTQCKHANHYATIAAVTITIYSLIIWKTFRIIITY